MSGTASLRRTAPQWAVPLGDASGAVDWIAAPPLPSGTPVTAYVVRTSIDQGCLVAAERAPGSRLPRWCPELHLNPDSSFCLGRRLFAANDDHEAAAFWQSLGEFLVAQHHAERRSRWPAGRWLSHGPAAADRQLEAEAAAAAAGFGPDYADCLERDEGWFAVQAQSFHGRLASGAACPRSCRDVHGRPIPVSRCRRRGALKRIVAAERARRAAHHAFFEAARAAGMTCCGRVAGCPLAEGTAA